MSNSEKLLKTLSSLIENGILEGGADKRGDNTALGY